MKKSIIMCPVGIPIAYGEVYDDENHWRFTKPHRQYETFVYHYNDSVIEPDSYDYIKKLSGPKWRLVKDFLDNFDYAQYEYIGFFDDDLVTDIQSVNRGIEIAREQGVKIFQLSMIEGSAAAHGVTRQNKDLKFTETNFVEGMGCFFHSSLIPRLLDFWKFHDPISGWGFDLIFSHILKEHTGIIHEVSMYHPNRKSSYDHAAADAEMYNILDTVYPKFMKDIYNEDVGGWDRNSYSIIYKEIKKDDQ
jgi:hypothetical protein